MPSLVKKGIEGIMELQLQPQLQQHPSETLVRVFHYVWHIGTMLLILGNLIGLCVIAAQLEVSRVAVSSVWNASHSNMSVMSTSPRLFLIPMRPIDGTDLIAAKALRVKRSNNGKVLVRKKEGSTFDSGTHDRRRSFVLAEYEPVAIQGDT